MKLELTLQKIEYLNVQAEPRYFLNGLIFDASGDAIASLPDVSLRPDQFTAYMNALEVAFGNSDNYKSESSQFKETCFTWIMS